MGKTSLRAFIRIKTGGFEWFPSCYCICETHIYRVKNCKNEQSILNPKLKKALNHNGFKAFYDFILFVKENGGGEGN